MDDPVNWKLKYEILLHILQSATVLFDEDIQRNIGRRKMDTIIKTFRDQIDNEVKGTK